MSALIETVEVDGETIQQLMYEKLMPACEGEHTGHAILALLTLSVIMMKPDVTTEQLRNCVMGMSEQVVLRLAEVEPGMAN